MKNQVISLDIYDTLIDRILPVEKIYQLLSLKYKINNFLEIRKEAEEKAKKKYSYIYTIYQIYEFIDLTEKEKILEDEIKYEIDNTTRNKIGEKIYNKLKEENTLICISDMYFTKEILQKILLKNGYTDINRIYVSCEYNASKRNLKLFKIAKKDFKNYKLTHIGDSIRSDYINAIFSGIKAKYIGKNNKNNYAKKLNKNEYLNYLGYKIYGPLVFEFCIWLNHVNDKNNKLLFLSREGETLKKCYNKLYKQNTDVFYVSRKSVLNGVLYDMIKSKSLDKVFKLIKKNRPEKIKDILIKMNVNLEKTIEKKFLESSANNENINKLIDIIYAEEKSILKILYEKNIIFKQYMRNKITDNTILVDLGWNGSMQNLINLYLKLQCKEVKGLYLGCLNNIKKDGFIFNNKGPTGYTILNYSGLLELLFMPPHGSVIDYKKTGNSIQPIFDKYEFTEESEQLIKNIQNGFLDYIEDRQKISMLSLYNKKEIIDLLNKVGLTPSKQDLKYFGNIEFYDNGKVEKLLNKKNFSKSEWKIGYLKNIFKIPLPYYNKLLLLIRRIKND